MLPSLHTPALWALSCTLAALCTLRLCEGPLTGLHTRASQALTARASQALTAQGSQALTAQGSQALTAQGCTLAQGLHTPAPLRASHGLTREPCHSRACTLRALRAKARGPPNRRPDRRPNRAHLMGREPARM